MHTFLTCVLWGSVSCLCGVLFCLARQPLNWSVCRGKVHPRPVLPGARWSRVGTAPSSPLRLAMDLRTQTWTFRIHLRPIKQWKDTIIFPTLQIYTVVQWLTLRWVMVWWAWELLTMVYGVGFEPIQLHETSLYGHVGYKMERLCSISCPCAGGEARSCPVVGRAASSLGSSVGVVGICQLRSVAYCPSLCWARDWLVILDIGLRHEILTCKIITQQKMFTETVLITWSAAWFYL